MNSTVRVRFPQYGIEVEVSKGTTILEAAKKAGIGIRSVCGGKGLCGKCKVLVASGGVDHKLGDRTLLAEDEIRKGYVLACIAKVMSDLEVVVPPESFIGRAKLLSTVALPQVSPQPSIILQRIDGASKIREYILSFRTSSDIIKKIEVSPNGSLVMDLYANKIVDFLPESRSIEGIYGIAVDIGTTKIVVALVDITSGRILGVESEFNRQLI
ncbi:MAG: 2Fe-2S iron-sulfur cluster-binding protein, partial [Ignisphaera sp.]